MRKRVKIKGHYMKVRQRSTSKGKKGTICGKWMSSKRGKTRAYRCAARTKRTVRIRCGHKRASKQCLHENKGSRKCSQLLISYN